MAGLYKKFTIIIQQSFAVVYRKIGKTIKPMTRIRMPSAGFLSWARKGRCKASQGVQPPVRNEATQENGCSDRHSPLRRTHIRASAADPYRSAPFGIVGYLILCGKTAKCVFLKYMAFANEINKSMLFWFISMISWWGQIT